MKHKRLLVSLVLGAISGVFCIIGVRQRIPDQGVLPSIAIYLTGAWYNRLILGALIGLAGEISLWKSEKNLVNAVLRGALLGVFVSLGFGLCQQFSQPTFIGAGAMFGALTDLIATWFVEKTDKK